MMLYINTEIERLRDKNNNYHTLYSTLKNGGGEYDSEVIWRHFVLVGVAADQLQQDYEVKQRGSVRRRKAV